MAIFQTFVLLLTQVLTFAIFARAILSWFPMGTTQNPIVAVLYQITEPILAPLRSVIPRIGMLDISPLVAIIVLQFIGSAVARF